MTDFDNLTAMRREYRRDLESTATEILESHAAYGDDVETLTHEATDGSEWTTYYGRAWRLMLISDNPEAWEDSVGLEIPPNVTSLDGLICTAAYFAMRADLESEIERQREEASETADA